MDDIQGILNAMMRTAVDPQTAAVAIAVIGLNIHFGYTGLINIGQSAFMLLGAYGFAISITQGWPLVIAVLIGLAVAFVFALVLGVPTLKLRGDYLAIVTISAAEIVRYVGRSVGYEGLFNLTGGAQGIPGSQYRGPFSNLSPFGNGNTTLLGFNYTDIAGGSALVRLVGWAIVIALIWLAVRVGRGRMGLEGMAQTASVIGLTILTLVMIFFLAPVSQQNTGVDGWWFTVVAWVIVGISLVMVVGLTRSPWGRALRGVREDEDAMRSLGKNVFAIKMQALIIGGLFGALGGIIYVLPASVQPDSMGRSLTFFCYTALLLGGTATIFGPMLGSVLFFAGRIFIKTFAQAYIPNSIMNDSRTEQFSYIVVGVALMLLVIFRPQGVLGNKRELRFDV
jgi:ABC-type branched-subunit amino acid transport system permease subunit